MRSEELRLGDRPAEDAARVRGQEDRLAAGYRVCAYHALTHGLEALSLFLGEVGEADLWRARKSASARNKVLDLLCFAGIGRRRRRACRRTRCCRPLTESSMQSRIFRWNDFERAVGVPRRLPRAKRRRRSSPANACWSLSRLDTSANVVGRRYSLAQARPEACSSSPRRVNASCCSSVICWPWKTSTAYSSIPAWIAATSSGESGWLRSIPFTSPQRSMARSAGW